MYIRKPGGTVMHDITPKLTEWKTFSTAEEVHFNEPLVAGSVQNFIIKNTLDLTVPCQAGHEPIGDGENDLIVLVMPGDRNHRIAGLFDGLIENNKIVTTIHTMCTAGRCNEESL